MSRVTVRLVPVALLGLLAACGKGSSTPNPPSAPVTVTVSPAGGSVKATDGVGNALTLSFPEGAVASSQEITVTPLPADGVEARFGLSPPGLALARPVTATLRTAGPLPVGLQLFWADAEDWSLLGGTVNGQELTLELPALGFAPPAAPRSRPTEPAPNGQLAAAVLDCEFELFQLNRKARAAQQRGDPESALREAKELKALRARCAGLKVEAITAAQCERFDQALLLAQATAVTDRRSLDDVAGNLMKAAMMVQLAGGGDCLDPSWQALFADKVNQYFTFLDALYSQPAVSPATYEEDLEKLSQLVNWDATCQLLGATDASVLCAPLRDQLYPGLLDRLREAGYADCLASGRAHLLAELFALRFGVESRSPGDAVMGYARYTFSELQEDLLHCGARLSLRVYEDAQGVPSERKDLEQQLAPAPSPGRPNNVATVRLPPGSSLMVGGAIPLPPCSGLGTAQEELVFRLGGKEVARRQASGLAFTLTPEVEVRLDAQALTSLALPTTGTLVLEVLREGTSCLQYGLPHVLYRVDVTLDAPGVEWSFMGPGWWFGTEVREHVATGLSCDFQDGFGTSETASVAAETGFPVSLSTPLVTLAGRQLDAGHAELTLSLNLPSAAITQCGGGSFTVAPSSAEVRPAVRVRPSSSGTLEVTPRWNAVVPVSVSPPSVYRFPDGAALVGNTSGAFFAPGPDGGVITVPVSPPEEVLIHTSVQYVEETAISVQDRTVMELRFTPNP